MYKLINKTFIIFFFLVSCSTGRGNLKAINPNKSIGIISFKILNADDEDITKSCVVQYDLSGEEYTPPYRLENAPHLLEFQNEFKVKLVHCIVGLLVYKYNFDSFDFKAKNMGTFNLGEYVLKYSYKESYRKTTFFKEAEKCEYHNDRSGYCGNSAETWTNEGQLRLLKIQNIEKNVLDEEFPNNGRKLENIRNMKPRNIL